MCWCVVMVRRTLSCVDVHVRGLVCAGVACCAMYWVVELCNVLLCYDVCCVVLSCGGM